MQLAIVLKLPLSPLNPILYVPQQLISADFHKLCYHPEQHRPVQRLKGQRYKNIINAFGQQQHQMFVFSRLHPSVEMNVLS